jgi:hypothetical protein
MPPWFAWSMAEITLATMRNGPESRREKGILLNAIDHGYALAYDGGLYLRNRGVVWAGAEVLGRALAIAHRYELPEAESSARKHFRLATDAAERSRPEPFQDAIDWLRYKERAALAGFGQDEIHPPADLERRIMTSPWDDQKETNTWRERWKRLLPARLRLRMSRRQ